MKTVSFHTFGCRLNQYETEAIREEVLALGYHEVGALEPADVHVVNTCAVTVESGVKARKHVLRVARLNPAARIVVVGCSTPSEKERLSRIPQVAFLAGNEEKDMVASFINGGWRPGEPFPERDRDIFRLRISRYADRTRANIKVQDGCDDFCSFCIIPFLRGRSRSRHPDAVVEEVRRLVENGYREIVVTGVHLQHYGSDLGPCMSLAALLRRVAAVAGGARIRMSSIGVRSFTPELIDVLSAPPFCPHWHVPLQSGSDAVLERMRRDYRLDDFRRLAAALRERFDDPSITTDIIVGHPGESERDFERTLEAAAEAGFSKIHVFPFSPREGTLATKLGGHVDPLEVRRRARVLRDLEERLALAYRGRFVGRTVEVLVEGSAAEGEDLEGTTDRYVKVRFPAPSPGAARRFPGTLQPIRVTAAAAARAAGAWAGEPELSEAAASP
jgi:threonylcarbamoyladenosine tRNA methylthiotransferase MtaB